MIEVELKVRADHDVVRGELPERAEHVGVAEQVDTYFDAPHRDFAETDEALRIRRERPIAPAPGDDSGSDVVDDLPVGGEAGQETVLAYKGPLLEAESKSREELKTRVDDGETLATALERLGFEPAAEVRKQRERFRVDEFTVTLDTVDGLGEFVEVDTEQAEDDIAETREAAVALLEELGCDPTEQIRTSYLGLLLAADRDGDDAGD